MFSHNTSQQVNTPPITIPIVVPTFRGLFALPPDNYSNVANIHFGSV